MSQTQTGGLCGHSRRGYHFNGPYAACRLLVGGFGYRSDFAGHLAAQNLTGGVIMKIVVFKVPAFITRFLGLFSRKKDA